MIYFIFGEDSYRSKRKLEEIILGYKKVHKSGLNLLYIDTKEKTFNDFYSNFKIMPMFAEKKLIILKNVFSNIKFQEEFLENTKSLEDIKDIIVIYEDCKADQRTKMFKSLEKNVTCQEFNYLQPALLRKWIALEFENNKTKINSDALELLMEFVKNDLWRMASEINKLSNYKKGELIKKEDVELLIKPSIENDIFKTIDAIASKNKKQALTLLYKHLDGGDAPIYLLSMIAYQFRSLLIIKELIDSKIAYPLIVKKSGLHPFVVKKNFYICNRFSFLQLKNIYHKIFQVDADVKTGKVQPDAAIELLLSAI